MNTALAQEQVRAFWNGQPCDSDLSDREPMSREYFLDIERHRYHLQPHILDLMDRIDFRDKRVVSISPDENWYAADSSQYGSPFSSV